jgi:hypothetical protein
MVHTYEVGQKIIGYDKGDDEKYNVFSSPAQDLLSIPCTIGEFSLMVGIPLYPILYPAKDHLHKDSLRADPTAKETAECDGKHHHEYNEGEHAHHKYEEILRPEYFAKQDEFTIEDIDQK